MSLKRSLLVILMLMLVILLSNVSQAAEIMYNVYYPYDCNDTSEETVSVLIDVTGVDNIQDIRAVKILANQNLTIEDFDLVTNNGKEFLDLKFAKQKGFFILKGIEVTIGENKILIDLPGSIILEGLKNYSLKYIYNVETVSRSEYITFRYRNISSVEIKVLHLYLGMLNTSIQQYDFAEQKWIQPKETVLKPNEEILYKVEGLYANSDKKLLFVRPLVRIELDNGFVYTEYDMAQTNYMMNKNY